MALLDDLDRRRESELQTRENSARLAQAYTSFYTDGIGSVQHKARVDFGLTFIERPFVSYGSTCDVEALGDVMSPDNDLSDDDLPLTLPLTSGFVTQWDQDERDFYIGCWVAVRVYFPTEELLESEAQPEVEHHFTFAGIAMKDIPVDKDDVISG